MAFQVGNFDVCYSRSVNIIIGIKIRLNKSRGLTHAQQQNGKEQQQESESGWNYPAVWCSPALPMLVSHLVDDSARGFVVGG